MALRLLGVIRYSIDLEMQSVHIYIERIENTSLNFTPRTQLKLCADGIVIGKDWLPPLPPNSCIENYSKDLNFYPPPAGEYRMSLHLEDLEMIDFNTTKVFRSEKVELKGVCQYAIHEGMCTIEGSIANNQTCKSGSLKLELWGFEEPFKGLGAGVLLCKLELEPLKEGEEINNFSVTSAFFEPPPGSYFVSMILRQYKESGYDVEDYVNFPNAKYLPIN